MIFIISISVAVGAIVYVHNHESSPMSVFLKYIVIYISVFAIFKLLPIFVIYTYIYFDDTGLNKILGNTLGIMWISSGIVFFVARLSEPNIRDLLKDEVGALFIRSKHFLMRCTCKRSGYSRESRYLNSLLVVRAFEDLKLEVSTIQKFEYILITILTALFDSVDNFSTPDISK